MPFIKYLWITLILLAVLIAIFRKKSWTLYISFLVAGLMFSLYGFTEIYNQQATVKWLHNVWGGIQFLIAIICFVASAISFIGRNKLNVTRETNQEQKLKSQE